jgi:protein-S-isoprenylcysteine O-methyltransferase Ste14
VFLFLIPPALVVLSTGLGVPLGPSAAGRIVAAVVFTAASALGLVSAMTMAVRGRGTPLPFDGARELVVTGPYAWVRNPMALAGLAQGAAVALWHGSALVGIYVVAGGFFWHVVVRPLEEADLARAFGDTFERYRARVPLWWPRRPFPRGADPDPVGAHLRAWVMLTGALAVHVADEALTGFLDVYNPLVLAARARWSWFPMPTFAFVPWLAGLTTLVVVLAMATPAVRRGARGPTLVSLALSVIMFMNGVGHLAGSILLARWLPGATSAPLLLFTSVVLARATLARQRAGTPGTR